MKKNIIHQYIEFILSNNFLAQKQISYLLIGRNFTLISLENKWWGIALTEHQHCCTQSHEQILFLKAFKRPTVQWLLEHLEQTPYFNSILCALANAWLQEQIDSKSVDFIEKDPVELIDLKGKVVTMVGYFQHYAHLFDDWELNWTVIEKDPQHVAPQHQHKIVLFDTDEWKKKIFHSDVNIITGSTVVNNTLEEIIHYVSPFAINVLTGLTAGGIPEVLAGYPIHFIAGSVVLSPKRTKKLTLLGAPGFAYFKLKALKKIVLTLR
ncbi:MAG: DUF364 domain-containing protein [Bacteroidales bacterium]|nr:DUF364 domain-containing protein [Bacteroidales bacterium]